jgi:hypothetical protein
MQQQQQTAPAQQQQQQQLMGEEEGRTSSRHRPSGAGGGPASSSSSRALMTAVVQQQQRGEASGCDLRVWALLATLTVLLLLERGRAAGHRQSSCPTGLKGTKRTSQQQQLQLQQQQQQRRGWVAVREQTQMLCRTALQAGGQQHARLASRSSRSSSAGHLGKSWEVVTAAHAMWRLAQQQRQRQQLASRHASPLR